MQFIKRLSKNPNAVIVKMMDLLDNVDITRLSDITKEYQSRLVRYQKAFAKLAVTYESNQHNNHI